MAIRRVTKVVLILIYGAFVLLSAPPSVWLLANAQTLIGVGIAVSGLMVMALPLAVYLWRRPGSHRSLWAWISLILGLGIAGVWVGILLSTPAGRAKPGSAVCHRFTREASFQPYTLTNVIPEAEQVNAGFLVMPWLDPILTAEQADRVSAFTLELYREMERDEDFRRLGSVMGWTYAELLGRPFNVGHYYLYVPRNRDEGPMPALVFLHGSAGNFKAYTWVWSKLAEELGMVVIAPSYGFGNWQRAGATDSVLRALDDAVTLADIDLSRVYLAGLSNGGLGVSQLASETPERFRGLIFISPVMVTEIVDSSAFHHKWRSRPVLVVTGEEDRRVSASYVRDRVLALKGGGVHVTDIVYPGEDHFLLFSQAKKVLSEVSGWLAQAGE